MENSRFNKKKTSFSAENLSFFLEDIYLPSTMLDAVSWLSNAIMIIAVVAKCSSQCHDIYTAINYS